MLRYKNALMQPLQYIAPNKWLGGIATLSGNSIVERHPHRRGVDENPNINYFDTSTVNQQSLLSEYKEINGKALFIGYMFTHFGHFVLESIPYLRRVCEDYDEIIAFSLGPPCTNEDSLWFKVLNYYRIDPRSIRFCWDPLRISELICFEQRMGYYNLRRPPASVIEDYLELGNYLADRTDDNLSYDKIYVSKSRSEGAGGSFFGEKLVESRMQKEGFKIIFLEDFAIETQVAILKSAKVLLMCEGSAIHTLLLSGAAGKDIGVITRRPDTINVFTQQLMGQGAKLHVFQHVQDRVQIMPGEPWKDLSIIGLNSLLHDITSKGFTNSKPKSITYSEVMDHAKLIGFEMNETCSDKLCLSVDKSLL